MDNSDRWSHLPNNILTDGQPAAGIRQADGTILCLQCTRRFDDNRDQQDKARGLKPSCPFCWLPVAVEGEAGSECILSRAADQAA